MPPDFRLLHASDLHLATAPGQIGVADLWSVGLCGLPRLSLVSSYDDSLLHQLARFAKARAPEIDGIVLTGDLATTGHPGDLAVALDFVTGPADPTHGWLTADGRPTLGGIGCPLWLLPGNHDRFNGLLLRRQRTNEPSPPHRGARAKAVARARMEGSRLTGRLRLPPRATLRSMRHLVVVTGTLASPRRIDLDEPVTDLVGKVEVVLVPAPEDSPARGQDVFPFLASLPPGQRSKEEIDRQISDERAGWDRSG